MDLGSIHAYKIRKYHIQINEVMCDTVTTGHEQTRINHCVVIYYDDSDFGSVDVINTDRFQQPELSHQRTKLLALLDKYSEYFSEKPGLCTVLQHKINVSFFCVLKGKDGKDGVSSLTAQQDVESTIERRISVKKGI